MKINIDQLQQAIKDTVKEMRYDNTFTEEVFYLGVVEKIGKKFQVQIKIVANQEDFIKPNDNTESS